MIKYVKQVGVPDESIYMFWNNVFIPYLLSNCSTLFGSK
jgi:hypothetical protein